MILRGLVTRSLCHFKKSECRVALEISATRVLFSCFVLSPPRQQGSSVANSMCRPFGLCSPSHIPAQITKDRLRIPQSPATQSIRSLPLNLREGCHPVHSKAVTSSMLRLPSSEHCDAEWVYAYSTMTVRVNFV
jgi:hypothetical protein